MTCFRKHCLPLLALLVLGLGYPGGTVRGQSPTPVGTVANIPPANYPYAFSTSLRYDAGGDLYAWDGLNVSVLSASGGNFNGIGSVSSGNSADTGPISFSQDGKTLLLSDGYGGYNPGDNGVFWTMPATGGAAAQITGTVPSTFDAVPLPSTSAIPASSTKYIVNAGNPDGSSTISIFDSTTGVNVPVIDNTLGASTSIAFNPKNNSVYFGVGYGTDVGNIYGFSLSQIDLAYADKTPILLDAGTTPFNSAGTGFQTGAGMFFDNNGFLFSGGDGITVFRPDGTISYDEAASAADGSFETLTFDPANNEVLDVAPYSASPTTGTLYNAADFETVPEPSTIVLLCGGALVGLVAWRRRRS